MSDAPVRLTLYTRGNCPLCDEAEAVLSRVRDELRGRLIYDIVAIDGDERLTEAYGTLIPVVAHHDQVLFIGNVSAHRLKQWVERRDGPHGGLKPRYKAYLERLISNRRRSTRDSQ